MVGDPDHPARRRRSRCRRTPTPATPAPTCHHRRRPARARRAGAGADRDRDRAARRVRRPGAPALRARGPLRGLDRQRARAPSTRATAARSRCCWSTSTRATPVELSRGDRIAQLVVQRVEHARFVEVDRLPGSARGDGRVRFHRRFRAPTAARRRPRSLRRRSDVPTQEGRRSSRPTRSSETGEQAAASRTDPRAARAPGTPPRSRSTRTTTTRVDLGGLLRHAARPGLEVQLQVDEASGQVVAVCWPARRAPSSSGPSPRPATATSGTTSAGGRRRGRRRWAAPPPRPRAPGAPSWWSR